MNHINLQPMVPSRSIGVVMENRTAPIVHHLRRAMASMTLPSTKRTLRTPYWKRSRALHPGCQPDSSVKKMIPLLAPVSISSATSRHRVHGNPKTGLSLNPMGPTPNGRLSSTNCRPIRRSSGNASNGWKGVTGGSRNGNPAATMCSPHLPREQHLIR